MPRQSLAVNDMCRVDGRPQQAGAQGTQQGRQDVSGAAGGDGADVGPGTSQVLLVPGPQCAHGCPEPPCDRTDIFVLDARVCYSDRLSLSLFRGLSPQAIQLLAENEGKGRTEMLSDTVTCALISLSQQRAAPLSRPHARMREGGRVGQDPQGAPKQRNELRE